jgi:hypothetical protein
MVHEESGEPIVELLDLEFLLEPEGHDSGQESESGRTFKPVLLPALVPGVGLGLAFSASNEPVVPKHNELFLVLLPECRSCSEKQKCGHVQNALAQTSDLKVNHHNTLGFWVPNEVTWMSVMMNNGPLVFWI